jgi:hypothetical protein
MRSREGPVVEDSVLLRLPHRRGRAGAAFVADKHLRWASAVALMRRPTPNTEIPHLLNTGITLIGKGVSIPANTSIGQNVLFFPI